MRFSTSSFVAGTVAALVLGSGTAVAATGGKFILGKSNFASTLTTLTNSAGTPLSLNAKSGTAPLRVNSSVKVANLNADKIDGLDSSVFARTSRVKTGTVVVKAFGTDLDMNGTVESFESQADCPAGTKLTGGGFYDGTQTGRVVYNGPAQGGVGWDVQVHTDNVFNESVRHITAYATCVDPTGAVTFPAPK